MKISVAHNLVTPINTNASSHGSRTHDALVQQFELNANREGVKVVFDKRQSVAFKNKSGKSSPTRMQSHRLSPVTLPNPTFVF